MFEIASKIVFCLLLAALLGFIIGYLFGKMQKCKDETNKSKDDEIYHPKESSTLQNVHEEKTLANSANESLNEAKPQALRKEDVEPDDLKKIKGIGKKIEASLNELGIYTFKQISLWKDAEVKWVDTYLVFKGRIEREEWIEQAKILASGGETEFSKKYK